MAGGIPVIPGLEQGMAGDRIERMEGILNGTCNFILSKMEAGAEYATVLAEAQTKGYAEADPTEDVGGFDARAKLAILMRLALRVVVDPEEIVPQPITAVTAVDFSYARDLSCTIRQVARAEERDGMVAATVGPMLVDQRSPLAWSRGTENMVILTGQYGGDVVFSGHGAGGHPTAVAVVSDLLALAHGSRRVEIPSVPARIGAEFEVPHYIRFLVKDRPGIVAEITGALARERINIRAIVQKPGYPAACAAVRGDGGAVQVVGAEAGAGEHWRDGLPAGEAAGFADAGVTGSVIRDQWTVDQVNCVEVAQVIDTIYRCEICGTESENPVRWIVIHCSNTQLTVFKWTKEAADAPHARHYCGEAHAQVYLSRWFESFCS